VDDRRADWRQIAGQVHLAENTVKNYVSNLLAKLGMERRTQAAVYAARLRDRHIASHRRECDRRLQLEFEGLASPGGGS